MTTDNTHGFRKAVTIFIDILGSQDRENFDEWYKIMRIFADTITREKSVSVKLIGGLRDFCEYGIISPYSSG